MRADAMPSSPIPRSDRTPSERPPADDAEWRALVEGALAAVLEAAEEGVIVFDRNGKCRMVGRRLGDLFGIDPAAIVGKRRPEVLGALAQGLDDPDAFLDELGAEDVGAPAKVLGEIDVVRPQLRKMVWSSFPILRHGMAWGRLGLVRDVTRERAAERATRQLQNRLEQLVPVDSLTGLPNARRFRDELEREHGRSTRAWDSYGIVRVDVDGMQSINEELGVPVGDAVLERVGECLNGCRREYDLVARLDGDEFAAILPGADRVAAETVAARMVEVVAAHDFELADRRQVTVCAGASVWVPPSGETGTDILGRAGGALSEAKGRGPGEIAVDAV
jgi:diguanylate cyclase (GGDEF)-like protein